MILTRTFSYVSPTKRNNPLFFFKHSHRKVRPGDRLGHGVIRREPPVSGAKIRILHEDDQILVADKPSSIPVHPCGQFHFNTLLEILNIEHLKAKSRLYTVHRLDLVTSGVVVFAKSSTMSNKIASEIKSHNVTKKYVARVRGIFPVKGEEIKTSCSTKCPKATYDWQDNGYLRVSVGIQRVSAIDGTYGCHDDGKESVSLFRRLGVLGDGLSVVECEPVTGRTHQLRLHLQFLGFPIENDSMYGGKCETERRRSKVFSVTKGMEGRNAPSDNNEDEDDNKDHHRRLPTSIYLHSKEFTLGKETFTSKLPSWAITAASFDEFEGEKSKKEEAK